MRAPSLGGPRATGALRPATAVARCDTGAAAMGDNDPAKAPAPVSLRITADAAAALDALTAATGGAIPRHRLMVAALTHGARALAADPASILPLLGLAPLLAAARGGAGVDPGAGVIRAATPVAPMPTPVVASSAPVVQASPPVAPASPPARSSRSTAARPAPVTSSAQASRSTTGKGPRDEAPPEAVEALRAELRAAVDRGASVNAITSAAGMASGGTRRRVAALLAGEAPSVSVQFARALTAAAERAGRGG